MLLLDRDVDLVLSLANPEIRSKLYPLLKEELPHLSKSAQEVARKIFPIVDRHPPDAPIEPWVLSQLLGELTDREKESLHKVVGAFLSLRGVAVKIFMEKFFSRVRKRRLYQILEKNVQDELSAEALDQLVREIRELQSLRILQEVPILVAEISPEEVVKKDLGPISPIPSHFTPFNRALFRGGYLPGELVVIAAAPAHGKSTWMLEEALHAASLGRTVFYIALGDMTYTDILVRLVSIYHTLKALREDPAIWTRFVEDPVQFVTQDPFYEKYRTDAILDRIGELHAAAKEVFSRIYILVGLPGRYGVDDIKQLMDTIPRRVDMLLVDYDSNLKAQSDNLYERGDEVYEQLVSLARPEGELPRVVIVGSQIKTDFWSMKQVPLKALAESSRKQHIADIVITIGRDHENPIPHQGVVSIVKNRRGPTMERAYYLFPTGVFVPTWHSLEKFFREAPPPDRPVEKVKHLNGESKPRASDSSN